MATTDDKTKEQRAWIRVLAPDELAEGRVAAVPCGGRTLCLTHHKGTYAALDNRCPHQGGPLGEGSIENGWLRCPWHGWDFDPLTGKSPGEFGDQVETFPTELRPDGVYVSLPDENARQRTVSDLMADTMVAWGVRWVFGMVGHSNLGLADAIRERTTAGEMGYFGIRHEGAASFACSAYGKLTGRLAACLSIAGPGATNLLTGLWDANVDRAPVLALTGQVQTQVLGPGAFQEVDLSAAFGKVATWSQPVLANSRHTELVNLACKSALLERGVAHLIFPDEVQTMPADGDTAVGGPAGRITARDIAPPPSAMEAAVERLARARRPAIIVGHGARFQMNAVMDLAEMLGSPVITTFKGKGLVSDRHPLGCGVLGRSGTPIASWFMNEADLLVVFGASFSDHTGITPKIPTIQVDYDPMILGKFHTVEVPVWGEIGTTARMLRERLEGNHIATDSRAEVAERWRLWRAEKHKRAQETGNGLHPVVVFDALAGAVPDDAIMCVDVGNNTYSFGRYFECTRQSVLMSGYLGSIGFALPAALGAWAATQEDDPRTAGRKVISISGDGGFGQYMGELTTAVKYGMNITHVLLNNSELAKISKEQRAGNWDVWQTSLHNPDFARYAELCGALGIRVADNDELEAAMTRAIAHEGPSLVEVVTDPKLI
ncbi:MAG: thiamine pyrophosphate-binding protein [Myxococcales bacterium]|nr:thiamine pyrophosphate-binding protein [Myxococcales bacterium]